MILSDVLKTLNPNEDVHISSKSAFFYMDKPDKFYQWTDRLNKQFRSNYEQRITGAEQRLENHKSLEPAKNRHIIKRVWENGQVFEKEVIYDELLDAWKKSIKRYELNLETAKKLYNEYTPIETREVIEVYRNIDNNATIIKIVGNENGRFWLKSEWERYLKTGKVFQNESEEKEYSEEDGDGEEEIV